MSYRLHIRMQCVSLLAATFLILGGRCSLSQSTPRNDDLPPAWRYQLPPAAGSANEDTRTPAEKEAEDDYFDSHFGVPDPLDGPQRGWAVGHSGPAVFDEDFPARFRDEIVVAHFTTWSTHLSSSHRSIYTIVNLQVDRVVADKSGHVTEGAVIPLAVPGGRARTLGGGVLTQFVSGRYFPLEPNIKYLIFLNTQPGLPFYWYVKAWNVDKGVLEPVTQFDAYRISQGHSSHAGRSLESAVGELSSR